MDEHNEPPGPPKEGARIFNPSLENEVESNMFVVMGGTNANKKKENLKRTQWDNTIIFSNGSRGGKDTTSRPTSNLCGH